jgi:hypothetical protein
MTDKKPVENVEAFNCLGSMIRNDARCTLEIMAGIAMAKQHSTRRRLPSPGN